MHERDRDTEILIDLTDSSGISHRSRDSTTRETRTVREHGDDGAVKHVELFPGTASTDTPTLASPGVTHETSRALLHDDSLPLFSSSLRALSPDRSRPNRGPALLHHGDNSSQSEGADRLPRLIREAAGPRSTYDLHLMQYDWDRQPDVLMETRRAAPAFAEEDDDDLAMELVADVTYKASLREQVLQRWRRALERLQNRHRHRELLAGEYHDRSLCYLFFRAWQWRHSRRVAMAARVTAATAMCEKMRKQRPFRAWIAYVRRQKELRDAASALAARNTQRMIVCSREKWILWCHRRSLAAALCVATAQAHCARALRSWCHHALTRSRHRLLLDAHQLHRPICWSPTLRAGGDLGELLWRSTWLQWLRFTYKARGERLARYAQGVSALQQSRERIVRGWCWQRWLLCTASAAQARRRESHTRRIYFGKWTHFLSVNHQAMEASARTQHRTLGHLFSHWHDRTARIVQERRGTATADIFFRSRVVSRTVGATFRTWRCRWTRALHRQRLRLAGEQARLELLRHVGMRRLVEGVLTSAAPFPFGKMQSMANADMSACEGNWELSALPLPPVLPPTRTAPLPLPRSGAPLETTVRFQRDQRVPLAERTVSSHRSALNTSSVKCVDRATSPVAREEAMEPKHVATQTSEAHQTNTRLRARMGVGGLSIAVGRHGNLPLYLRGSPVDTAPQSVISPRSDGVSRKEDLLASGTALVSAYRRLKAAAAEEHEELIHNELEAELLTAYLDMMEATNGDCSDSCGPPRAAVVAEAASRAHELATRRAYLLLRDEQRRRLRVRVEQLATTLAKRLHSS